MRRHDKPDGKGQEPEFVRMPYLLGYQQNYAAYEKEPGDKAPMMMTETMP
jgi:hypothetical protein